jgi:membrane-bound lytic murein transglycosylase A
MPKSDEGPSNIPVLTPVSFNDLPGWKSDKVMKAKPALLASCARILQRSPEDDMGAEGMAGKAADWHPFCRDLIAQPARDELAFRSLLDNYLQPFALSDNGEAEGLFTGYYEAELRGSRTRQGAYQTPLYKRPPELVTVDLGKFRPDWKGQRTAGEVVEGRLVPYADRAAISAGKLAGRKLELLWLDNSVDAFFVQVQGSGRVKLPDGKETRLGFDAQNGHPYTAIGREMIADGLLKRDEVSMQIIRKWLETHPDKAEAMMSRNRSYVFFRELPMNAGPVGAEGTLLTPERSLAVDNRYIAYGVPVWLDTVQPVGGAPLQRLMVAQDTGGAIVGVVRGDVFWGHGAAAEKSAGQMKSRGRFFMLLPKTVYDKTP